MPKTCRKLPDICHRLINNRFKGVCNYRHSLQKLYSTEILTSQFELSSSKEKSKPIIANLYIDEVIVQFLQMKHHYRKSRMVLSTKNQNHSLTSIRDMIENKVLPLAGLPYRLKYRLSKGLDKRGAIKVLYSLNDDTDVTNAITEAIQNESSIQFYIQNDPGKFPNVTASFNCDPAESPTLTLVSFYAFGLIEDPQSYADQLYHLWKPFNSFGRIYVAKEGVNAQMAIPTNVLQEFKIATEKLQLFQNFRLNADHLISREEFLQQKPFKALHIRVREQIVTDGLPQPLDWTKAGKSMSPSEWHQKLDDPNTIILDCRNSYESDVGVFDGAIPLNTTMFRDSWPVLDQILKDKPKDSPILTYCTGGIRCVKVNAYLEQVLGFNNTASLSGGIISYARDLEMRSKLSINSIGNPPADSLMDYEMIASGTDAATIPIVAASLPESSTDRNVVSSKFRGLNYVFDDRFGARITNEILSFCETCGDPCDGYINCNYPVCNLRYIQCSKCRSSYKNCCSMSCAKECDSMEAKETMVMLDKPTTQSAMNPRKVMSQINKPKPIETATDSPMGLRSIHQERPSNYKDHALSALDSAHQVDALYTYSERCSETEPTLLQEVRNKTIEEFQSKEGAVRMICDHLQGRLLSLLASAKEVKNVLELGSFTGYSALCFAEGLLRNPQTSNSEERSGVVTCEIDEKAANIAQSFFDRHPGAKITLLRKTAAATIEWARQNKCRFDLVFIDADKKNYRQYLTDLMGESGGDCLLNDHALVIADNTLWKGLILSQQDDADLASQFSPNPADYSSNPKKMMDLAKSMHKFNQFVQSHPKLSPVLLPLRDGITLARFHLKAIERD